MFYIKVGNLSQEEFVTVFKLLTDESIEITDFGNEGAKPKKVTHKVKRKSNGTHLPPNPKLTIGNGNVQLLRKGTIMRGDADLALKMIRASKTPIRRKTITAHIAKETGRRNGTVSANISKLIGKYKILRTA